MSAFRSLLEPLAHTIDGEQHPVADPHVWDLGLVIADEPQAHPEGIGEFICVKCQPGFQIKRGVRVKVFLAVTCFNSK